MNFEEYLENAITSIKDTTQLVEKTPPMETWLNGIVTKKVKLGYDGRRAKLTFSVMVLGTDSDKYNGGFASHSIDFVPGNDAREEPITRADGSIVTDKSGKVFNGNAALAGHLARLGLSEGYLSTLVDVADQAFPSIEAELASSGKTYTSIDLTSMLPDGEKPSVRVYLNNAKKAGGTSAKPYIVKISPSKKA